ncbi:MAG: hypothetical protein JWO36_3156 [Myxococcales bacterium]|nr:hypothetical protein [Myxococcales bacterium]
MRVAHMRVVLTLFIIGCVAPVPVRSASVLRPGEITGTVSFGGVFTAGEATVKRASATTTKEHSYLNWNTSSSQPFFVFLAAMLHVNVGVSDSCEVSTSLGVSRLGGEARCALSREEDGGPSIAAAIGAYYLPFGGPEAIAGIDISHRFGADHSVFTNLYASVGDYPHGAQISGPGVIHDSPFARFDRRELRLNAALGMSFHIPDDPKSPGSRPPDVYFAIVPYWAPRSGTARLRSCDFCGGDDPITDVSWSEGYGIGFVYGVGSLYKHAP